MAAIIYRQISLREHNGVVRRFEILPHTADVAVAVFGDSLEELFANAGAALFELMFDTEAVEPAGTVQVEATGDGLEELLVEWLSELVVLFEVEGVAVTDLRVDMDGHDRVTGTARTVPTGDLVLAGAPIKAVTYHDLEVRRDGDHWVARVVFDV
jgi:SHS2 domain-containing protein